MPTISRFFGIVIRMHYEEHPPPHFHAHYAENDAAIYIDSLEVREGFLPKRVLAMVLEWAFQHREELRGNWRRAEQQQPLNKIEPLE